MAWKRPDADERPILAHLDEAMRAHIEFTLQRYQFELEQWNLRKKGQDQTVINELVMNSKCLREIKEAGT